MVIAKDLISSPLEAGTSLCESQKLPPQLHQALDYISDRLVRKNLHLTLIAVRHDLPPAPATPSSPSIRSATPTSLRSPSSLSFSKFQLPSLPGSPRSFTSSVSSSSHSDSPFSPFFPPSTPRTPTSVIPPRPKPQGISLHHASSLTPKASQRLQESIAKASKKFSLPNDSLKAPSSLDMSTSTLPSTNTTLSTDLIRRSLQHNEVLFSTEGLTLLSLDRVYTFKLALSAYTRTLTPIVSTPAPPSPLSKPQLSREEKLHQRNAAKTAAVDELRLLVLSQKGRRISQSYLLRAYDHLPVSHPALRSVNEAYKTAFHADGIELDSVRPPIPETQLLRTLSGRIPGQLSNQPSQSSLSSSISSLSLSPSAQPQQSQSAAKQPPQPSRLPLPNPLASNPTTTNRHPPRPPPPSQDSPLLLLPPAVPPSFPRYSAAQGWVDHATPPSGLGLGLDRGPHLRAPPTPAGYEEVTPITRGEWNYLMGAGSPAAAARESHLSLGLGPAAGAAPATLGTGWFNRRGVEIC